MPHALFAQQKTRLLKRNTETEESLQRRLNIAELDMEYGMIKLFVKTCSNKANIVQHCWVNNVARCWTKILGKFKLKPTLSNIIANIVLKRGQHVASNNVEWCWTSNVGFVWTCL